MHMTACYWPCCLLSTGSALSDGSFLVFFLCCFLLGNTLSVVIEISLMPERSFMGICVIRIFGKVDAHGVGHGDQVLYHFTATKQSGCGRYHALLLGIVWRSVHDRMSLAGQIQ